MDTLVKVLIVEPNKEFSRQLVECISGCDGLVVVGEARDGLEAVTAYKSTLPDVVISELVLPKLDGLGAWEEIKYIKRPTPVSLIVLSAFYNEDIAKRLSDLGTGYYMLKPVDLVSLRNRIYDLTIRRKNEIRNYAKDVKQFTEGEIVETLMEAGIPCHVKGFQYLKEGLGLAIEDRENLDLITKKMYPMVAERYGSTDIRVQRAMRNAIELAWENKEQTSMGLWFKDFAARPNNTQFISVIKERMVNKVQ